MPRALTYTKRKGTELCRLIAAGETITAASRAVGLNDHTVVYKWLDNEKLYEFHAAFSRAREHAAHSMVAKAVDRVECLDRDCPRAARVYADTMTKLAGMLNPHEYSEKQIIENIHKLGGPVANVTINLGAPATIANEAKPKSIENTDSYEDMPTIDRHELALSTAGPVGNPSTVEE